MRPAPAPDTLANASDFVPDWQQAKPVPCAPGETKPFWESVYEGAEGGEASAAPHAATQPATGDSSKAAAQPPTADAGAEAARLGAAAAHALPANSAQPLVLIKPRARGRAAPPSSHAQRSPWALDPFTDDDIALRGVFVHECFREVRSIDDLAEQSRRDALIERARRRAAVEKGAPISDELADEIRGVLARIASTRGQPGSIASALEVAGDPASARVLAELAFAREVDGAIINGRIDRLVLSLRGGVPVGATIIDFKTGAKDSPREVLDAKIAGYRSQLEAYGDAVAEMFTIPREAVRLELLFVDRGEVVVLGSS
jgi:hypothetical protein